ncbi:hypothetical protein DV736_g3301, partial [Chaetothyriales sp. CBS 134916]
MDDCCTIRIAPYQAVGTDVSVSRILTSCTANIQPHALDSHEGIENQNPCPQVRGSIEPDHGPESQYPIPQFKLGSNDQHAQNVARLQARRQNKREWLTRRIRTDSGTGRPYLQHPKYLQYRARQRCDTGADGKPVWDDRIEDAFQNALVNIEPMGRRKKSQRGDALTTPDEKIRTERSSHKYFSGSIEGMARDQRPGGEAWFYGCNDASNSPPSYEYTSDGGFVEDHHLTRLSFAMWVSPPKQMDQALHTYTRVQSSDSTLVPIPLENVKNWRSSFPSLSHIIDNSWTSTEQCDIILLEAGIELMGDFPPKFSKLGIALELDFRHPPDNKDGSLANLTQWTCVTQIFQNGQLGQRPSHQECHVTEVGKVKPFFESKWWATTFTQLTEKRKMAENLRSSAAINAANEAMRKFFCSLTVTQEISAETVGGTTPHDICTTQARRRKRMAILLWRFFEAPSNFVGVTTWQKVDVRSELNSTNSPAPLVDMPLGPMNVETVAGHGYDDSIFKTGDEAFLSDGAVQPYDSFDVNMGVGFCQDDFIGYRPEGLSCLELLQSCFDIPATDLGLDADINLSVGMSQQDLPQCQDHHVSATTNYFELDSDAGAESQSGLHALQHSSHNSFHSQQDAATDSDREIYDRQQADVGHDDWSFTIAQLEPRLALSLPPPSIPQSPVDPEDEPLRAALLVTSSLSGLSNHHSALQSQSQTGAPTHSSITSAPSKATADSPMAANLFASPSPSSAPGTCRQPLQSHHSWCGFSNHWSGDRLPCRTRNSPNNILDKALGHPDRHHSGQSQREDFERLLALRQAYVPRDSDGSGPDTHTHFSTPADLEHGRSHSSIHDSDSTGLCAGLHLQHLTDEIRRPHSQPVFSTSAIDMPVDVLDDWLRAYRKSDGFEHGQELEQALEAEDVNTPRRTKSAVSGGGWSRRRSESGGSHMMEAERQ